MFEELRRANDSFLEFIIKMAAHIDISGMNWLRYYDIQIMDEVPSHSDKVKWMRLMVKPFIRTSYIYMKTVDVCVFGYIIIVRSILINI